MCTCMYTCVHVSVCARVCAQRIHRERQDTTTYTPKHTPSPPHPVPSTSGMHPPSALHKALLLGPHTLALLQTLTTTYGSTPAAQECIDTLQAVLRVCAVNMHAELTKVNAPGNTQGGGSGRGGLLAPWRWKLDTCLLADAQGVCVFGCLWGSWCW